jgi:hypothetical protein
MNLLANPTINCLRCSGVELTRLPGSAEEITFFECPSCYRHYAQRPGHSLTYRWLHPISLALYCILFDRDPLSKAPFVAEELMRRRSRDESLKMIEEIELELQRPTQNVRDMLNNPQSEEECRVFLQAIVTYIREQ